VPRIAERPQERHGDRVHPVGEQGGDRVSGPGLVEWDHHFALVVHPFVDLPDPPARHQRGRLAGAGHVLDLVGAEAGVAALDVHDRDGVGVPLGGDQADAGHLPGEQGVQRRGGAVGEVGGLRQQRAGADPEGGRQLVDDGEEAPGEVRRRRRHLRRGDAPVLIGGEGVGEGPAGVDPDDVGHSHLISEIISAIRPDGYN